MDHHHGASTLPAELVSLVFDSLSLDQLLAASHVSKYWRTTAFGHPTFWRNVMLCDASENALDFFHARLDAGASRSVRISVFVPPSEFPEPARSSVLRTISRNLYRVLELSIQLERAHDRQLYLALHHPAPRLETLDICFVYGSQTSIVPNDLFACHAPNLRYLRLKNVLLRPSTLPHVCLQLKQLNYRFNNTIFFPAALLAHCRTLETLVISGKHCAESEGCLIRADGLRRVEMVVSNGSSDLMLSRLPCASIPEVSVALHDHRAAHALLGHLRGPLELHVQRSPVGGILHLRYRSPGTGTQRTFRGALSLSQLTSNTLPPVYTADELTSRVDALHVEPNCTRLLPAFHELASCTRVALSLPDGAARPKHPARALSVPSLERIELFCAVPRSLDAGLLVAFLDTAFAPGSNTVQLTTTGVSLHGDVAKISGGRFVLR